MATYTEIERLVIETEGRADLEQLRAELNKMEGDLLALAKANNGSAAAQAAFDAELAKSGPQIIDHRKQIKDLETVVNGASKGAGQYKQNLTALGYGLNDFFGVSGDLSQRLNAIANNIPGMLAGFGGLGLALSALVPIVAIVIRNWDNLTAAFGGDTDKINDRLDTLKERIKELEKEPHKIPVEVLELENARREVEGIKDALAAIDRFHRQAEAESKSGKAVETAFAESPEGEAAMAAMRAQMVRELMAQSSPLADSRREQARLTGEIQELRESIKAAREAGNAEMVVGLNASLGKVEADLEAAKQRGEAITTEITKQGGGADRTLGKILDDATKGKGDAQARAQAELARRLQGVGQGGLASQVQGSSPDEIRARAEAEVEFDVMMKEVDLQIEEEKKAKAARDAKDRRERAGAVRATFGELGDTLKKLFTEGLKNDRDRDELAAVVRDYVRNELDHDNKVPAAQRAGVAQDVADRVVNSVSDADVEAARAKDTKAGAKDVKKDDRLALAAARAADRAAAQRAKLIADSTTLDERAALEIARLQAQGVDPFAAKLRVGQQVGNELRRQFSPREMPDAQVNAVATDLTANAAKAAEAARLGLGNQGAILSLMSRLTAASFQNVVEQRKQAGEIQRIGQAVQQLSDMQAGNSFRAPNRLGRGR